MDPLAPDRWAEIDALFEQALDRPPDERTAFLRATCGHDSHLYHAVTALLAADVEAESDFAESATAFASQMLGAVAERHTHSLAPGTLVGPYRIEGELGRGGMGVVYLAERADGTFEKAVALKLVKRGMDTDEVLRRFRYERRVLAGLDHPYIARLLDAGATEDGRPFLVMECVEGEPITRYADARTLGLAARIALFEQVCEAVAYAHRHLVVHRDLKPSNILVREDETGQPQVKLLDFGIAKLLSEEANGDVLTRPERRILTPEYAAPEQLGSGAVTAATDVYALGVLLHELLVGERPAQPPVRPSEAAPPAQQRALRGDLDTLVLTALRPDPARRYASAEALLDDLRRRREGLPLRARPDSRGYRVRKFIGRHRWGVGVAAVALLALIAFAVVVSLQQRETARERDRAALELAQKEQVTAFLTDMFNAAHPGEARGDTLTAYDLLARGTARVEADLADQPGVQAEMLATLGGVYFGLGRFDQAEPLLRQALPMLVALHGKADPRVTKTRSDLSLLLWERGDYVGAEALQREIVQARTAREGAGHPSVAAAQDHLALMLWEQGRYQDAVALWREALATRRATLDATDPHLAAGLHNLGLGLHAQGYYVEAEALYREALAIARTQLGLHLSTAVMTDNLSRLLAERGQVAEAVPLAREALSMRRQVGGETHPHVAESLLHLGLILIEADDLDAAEPLLTDALERHRGLFGEAHPFTAASLEALGRLHHRRGLDEAAEATLRQALELSEQTLGPEHPKVGLLLYRLGLALQDAGHRAEAGAALRRAVHLFDATLPADYPYRTQAEAALAEL